MSCRICHEPCYAKDSIEPCHCKGSLRYVHPHCLSKWMQSSRRTTCEVCHRQFPVYKYQELAIIIIPIFYYLSFVRSALTMERVAAGVFFFNPAVRLLPRWRWSLAWLAFATWVLFWHADWFEYFEYNCYGDKLARFIFLVEGALYFNRFFRIVELLKWMCP